MAYNTRRSAGMQSLNAPELKESSSGGTHNRSKVYYNSNPQHGDQSKQTRQPTKKSTNSVKKLPDPSRPHVPESQSGGTHSPGSRSPIQTPVSLHVLKYNSKTGNVDFIDDDDLDLITVDQTPKRDKTPTHDVRNPYGNQPFIESTQNRKPFQNRKSYKHQDYETAHNQYQSQSTSNNERNLLQYYNGYQENHSETNARNQQPKQYFDAVDESTMLSGAVVKKIVKNAIRKEKQRLLSTYYESYGNSYRGHYTRPNQFRGQYRRPYNRPYNRHYFRSYNGPRNEPYVCCNDNVSWTPSCTCRHSYVSNRNTCLARQNPRW